nr:MAG TPA: hypothetical protein [Caudoviricetes sp.]
MCILHGTFCIRASHHDGEVYEQKIHSFLHF